MLEPYFTAKYKGIGSSYKQFEFLIEKLDNDRHNSAATIGKIAPQDIGTRPASEKIDIKERNNGKYQRL